MANEKILVVDDDANICELLRLYLTKEGYQVTTAGDGEEGLEKFNQIKPDMVLLDVMMPRMDGLEVCRRIRKAGNTPVMMLTAKGETFDKVLGLELGADDYMVKPFDFRELNARIKVLLKRNTEQTAPEPEQLTYANLRIDLRQHEVFRGQTPVRLSPKEYNLLVYMTQHAERVISRMEIAENVWNTHFDTGTNFIDVYINYLRKKIDRDFEPKLIHTKPGVGFIFTDKL